MRRGTGRRGLRSGVERIALASALAATSVLLVNGADPGAQAGATSVSGALPAVEEAGSLSATFGPSGLLAPGATTAHPFSNPVWYPIRTAATMGCVKGNLSLGTAPSCRELGEHPDWAMDLISAVRSRVDPLEPVYPMGAGILRYGATGQGCGTTHSRGNWVMIEHGNGLLSYYAHLGRIRVANGTYVTPNTVIGTIGNSGYSRCREVPDMRYLHIAVKRGGTSGKYVEIPTLRACVAGVRQTWPGALPINPVGSGRWDVWNDVPARVSLPAPDRNSSCIPASPATARAPSGARFTRSAVGIATASWYRPLATWQVTGTNVQFQQWHPSINRWLDHENRVVTSGQRARFTGLKTGKLYRIRVSFRNSVGWSAPSPWRSIRSL